MFEGTYIHNNLHVLFQPLTSTNIVQYGAKAIEAIFHRKPFKVPKQDLLVMINFHCPFKVLEYF